MADLLGALLGGDLDYETFASDPDFVADAGGDGQPANLQATLNWDHMMAFRRKLPFLEDADARQG